MRILIVSTYVTLDGVSQSLDWSAQYPSPASREERGKYARALRDTRPHLPTRPKRMMHNRGIRLVTEPTPERSATGYRLPASTLADDGTNNTGAFPSRISFSAVLPSSQRRNPLRP
jgi:hypothetical protein